jgi:hypothetical protein
MVIATLVILLCGAGNFAMHRWMLESGHPMVEAATRPFRQNFGRHATYVIEFLILVGALWMVQRYWFGAMMIYCVYTAFNAATIAMIKGPPKR